MFMCASKVYTCLCKYVEIRKKHRIVFTSFETGSLCCLLPWTPQYLDSGILGFSCLCLPSLLRSNGITDYPTVPTKAMGIQTQVLIIVEQTLCPISHLSTFIFIFTMHTLSLYPCPVICFLFSISFFSCLNFMKTQVQVAMGMYDLHFVGIQASYSYSFLWSGTELWNQSAIVLLVCLIAFIHLTVKMQGGL